MTINSELIVQITGTLIFGSSFVFFLRQYRDNLKKNRSGKPVHPDPTLAVNLFFALTSLVIILNIWNAPLRDFFTGILFLCALVSWLAWKHSQQTKPE
jgi:hypothetical protein